MTQLNELKRSELLDFDYVIKTFWDQEDPLEVDKIKNGLAAETAFLSREKLNPTEDTSPLANVLQINYKSGNVLKLNLLLEHGNKGKILGIESINIGYCWPKHLERIEVDLIMINGINTPILFDDAYIGNHSEGSMHINEFIQFLMRYETFGV